MAVEIAQLNFKYPSHEKISTIQFYRLTTFM